MGVPAPLQPLGSNVRRPSASALPCPSPPAASLPKRISEKCPSGGIGRRSMHAHAAVALRPSAPAAPSGIPAASRAGARPARSRCSNARRSPASAPRWLTRMISPPGLVHARELVERRLRVRHRGDDVLRHHHVEGGVGKAEMLRVHHRQRLDIGELVLGDALVRLAQHRLGIVDADDAVGAAHSRAAKCRCRRRRRGCARRCARPPRSRPCGRRRTPRRTRDRRPAPSAHRPCATVSMSISPAIAPVTSTHAATAGCGAATPHARAARQRNAASPRPRSG